MTDRPPHHGPAVDKATKHARVLDALLVAGADGLTAEELYMRVRHHLTRAQVQTTLTQLRQLEIIDQATKGSALQSSRWRLAAR